MDQEMKFTNQQIIAFCDRIKGCEDAIKHMNETTLNYIKEAIDRIEKRQEVNICTTDERLDHLENWKSYLTGALFVVSFAVGIIGTTVWNYYVNYPQIIRDAVKAELGDKYNINIDYDKTYPYTNAKD